MTENPYGSGYDQGGAQPAGGLGPMPGANEVQQVNQGPAPADVETSYKLWLVSIAIGIIGGIIGFVLADRTKGINTLMNDPNNALTRDQANTAITVGLVVGLVIGLILLALELFFMYKMRAGRNWARIVLTVLGVLSVLSGLFGLSQGFSAGSVLTLISLVVVIAAIAFMYKPAASAYFKGPKY